MSDRIQIGTVGIEVCEEFPSQECSLTLIIRDWESLEDSVKRCVMVSKQCSWSGFAFTILMDSSLYSSTYS